MQSKEEAMQCRGRENKLYLGVGRENNRQQGNLEEGRDVRISVPNVRKGDDLAHYCMQNTVSGRAKKRCKNDKITVDRSSLNELSTAVTYSYRPG